MESAVARRALALLWLAFAVYFLHPAVGLGGKGLDSFFNDWLYNGLLVLAALACFARGLLRRDSQRAAWLLVGVALSAWATGDIYYSVALEHLSSIPFPSIDDAFYLAFYPPAYVAIGLFVRSRTSTFRAQQLARRAQRRARGGRGGRRGRLPGGAVERRGLQSRRGGHEPRLPAGGPAAARRARHLGRAQRLARGPRLGPDGGRPHAVRAERQHLPVPDGRRHLPGRRHPRRGLARRLPHLRPGRVAARSAAHGRARRELAHAGGARRRGRRGHRPAGGRPLPPAQLAGARAGGGRRGVGDRCAWR